MTLFLTAVLLAVLGASAALLSGRLPMSGRAALALAGLPLLGLYLFLPLC